MNTAVSQVNGPEARAQAATHAAAVLGDGVALDAAHQLRRLAAANRARPQSAAAGQRTHRT